MDSQNFEDIVAERAEAVRRLCVTLDVVKTPLARKLLRDMIELSISTIEGPDKPAEKSMAEKIAELSKKK